MKQYQTKTKSKEGGQVLLIITLFLLAGSMVIVGTLIALVRSQVIVATELTLSKEAYILTEGALEEVVYRHKNAFPVAATETLTEGDITIVTTTTNTLDGKIVQSVGNEKDRIRKMEAVLIEGDGAAFSFGVQTDNGGIILENNSSVDGNIYSNGPIIGSVLSLVKGTAISAGPSGYITEVHATGGAYAHDIDSSLIDGDAFYTNIDISTIVNGTKYPGSSDLATSTLPIPDTLIDSWELYAASSSVMSAECIAAGGTLEIDYDITLGPVMIPCNVTFKKFPEVTITGVIWIQGDLTFTQGPKFTIDPAIGNKSVPIIVDNPADRLTSGRIVMNNSGEWNGNGDHSYILLLSRNESAEQGGSEEAITITNSTGGSLLVYAGHGEILMQNNTDLTEITAFRVRLQNNTEVKYDMGIASTVFMAGPGGSYVIETWQEIF